MHRRWQRVRSAEARPTYQRLPPPKAGRKAGRKVLASAALSVRGLAVAVDGAGGVRELEFAGCVRACVRMCVRLSRPPPPARAAAHSPLSLPLCRPAAERIDQRSRALYTTLLSNVSFSHQQPFSLSLPLCLCSNARLYSAYARLF